MLIIEKSSMVRYGSVLKVAAAKYAGWNREQRVAVGRGAGDLRRRGRAGRTRFALDQHPLAQPSREAVGDDPRHQIGGPARGKTVHHGDGPVRPVRIGSGRRKRERAKSAGDRRAARQCGHDVVLPSGAFIIISASSASAPWPTA